MPDGRLSGGLADGGETTRGVRRIGPVAADVLTNVVPGRLGVRRLYRDREATLECVEAGRLWNLDVNGTLFRMLGRGQDFNPPDRHAEDAGHAD